MRTSQSAIHHMDVGAEVIGIDSKTIITESMKEELYCAWKKFGILVFYDVDTIERHIEISEVFGKLAPHPIPELRSLENPLLLQIGGELRAPAYVFDDKDIRIERIAWHRDTAFTPDIAKGSMLRMVTAPRKNGETLFADTAMAYDALSPTMKKRLVGLEYKASLRTGPMEQHRPGCFWKTVRPATADEDPQGRRDERVRGAITTRYPAVVHPVLVTHPETGKICLGLNLPYVDYFLGLPSAESDDLIEELAAHLADPRFTYMHTWKANDAIVWDNFRMMHAAMGYPVDETRKALRTTFVGRTRTGRYFDENAVAPEEWAYND